MLLLGSTADAQEMVFQLDTAQSRVEFTLGDILHTVHGTFQLKSGTIRFNPANGEASGALVVDATSGDSGNARRDRRMHRQILEDQKYPEIVFTPQHVSGKLASQGTSQMELQGVMSLHGQQHPMTIAMPVQVSHDQASADVHFVVPYVKWGLKNPSTFILRVSETVNIDVHAVGHLGAAPDAGRAYRPLRGGVPSAAPLESLVAWYCVRPLTGMTIT
ncbi:MAG TPA: YceI family protein [Terriglobales bacterium]|nr:YceI family protein [Terriglobales bacterium]